MAITKFGKEIILQVYKLGEDGIAEVKLEVSSLRIDFDIKNMMGYNRAKFSIYNLNNTTIKDLSNEERFIRIAISLHGREPVSLGDDFYISNTVTEVKLPNVITTLYCMSGRRRSFMEKQVKEAYTLGTLEEVVAKLLQAAKATDITTKFELFPEKIEVYKPQKTKEPRFDGSVENELIKLSKMYNFNYYLQNNKLRIVYNANTPATYVSSGLSTKEKEEVVVIPIANLRSNPKVGTGTIQVETNMDGSILPGDILDTHNMITASTESSFEYLVAADQGLKAAATRFSKYSIYSVVHKGSNYTGDWSTLLLGTTAKNGNSLSQQHFKWFGGS